MTILVYVNTGRQVGDKDHIKLFATTDAAEKWFEENDPEGVAFEYEVLEQKLASVNGVGGVAILLLFSACEMSTRLMVFQLAGQADAHRLGLYVVRLRRKPSYPRVGAALCSLDRA